MHCLTNFKGYNHPSLKNNKQNLKCQNSPLIERLNIVLCNFCFSYTEIQIYLCVLGRDVKNRIFLVAYSQIEFENV